MAEKNVDIHYDLLNSIIPMYDKREVNLTKEIKECHELLSSTLEVLKAVVEGELPSSRVKIFGDVVRVLPPPDVKEFDDHDPSSTGTATSQELPSTNGSTPVGTELGYPKV